MLKNGTQLSWGIKHEIELSIEFCVFNIHTEFIYKNCALFSTSVNFEAERAQNNSKRKNTFHKHVLEFNFATIKGSALQVVKISAR